MDVIEITSQLRILRPATAVLADLSKQALGTALHSNAMPALGMALPVAHPILYTLRNTWAWTYVLQLYLTLNGMAHSEDHTRHPRQLKTT